MGELRPEGVEQAVHEPWVALPGPPCTPAPRGVVLAVAFPLPAGVDGGGESAIHGRILTGPGRIKGRTLLVTVPGVSGARPGEPALVDSRAGTRSRVGPCIDHVTGREDPHMEFGRLDDISGVDWTLPPDDPSCADVLGGAARPVDLRIGVATWSDAEAASRGSAEEPARTPSGPTPARCRPTS